MSKEKRDIFDYYYDKQFLFRIGHVQYLEASRPLSLHTHDSMTEFVYMERGSQNYLAAGENFIVNQGEVFFTRPYELHNTGASPEEVSVFYFFIIDLPLAFQLNLFVSAEESERTDEFFQTVEGRIFKASPKLPDTLRLLLGCFQTENPYFDTHIRNALSEVLIALSTPFDSGNRHTHLNIERSLRYIDEHLNEDIPVSALPSLDNMSLSSYNKYFLQAVGIPPGEYILKKKIEKSRELLSNSELSVTEIAYACGFSSSQYYATVFKRFCFTTPTQYRDANRAANN